MQTERKVKRKLLSLPLNHVLLNEDETYDISTDYEIGPMLGFGTYAQVKLATDKRTEQQVAVKISRGDTSIAMLRREKDILQTLASEFVPKVIDFKVDKIWKRAYLVMEKVEGEPLSEFLRTSGKPSIDVATSIVCQLCKIVRFLHESNICHRDIKPQNVMISKENKLKLIDFNISKVIKRVDGNGEVNQVFLTQISTPMYAAPEVYQGIGYNESVDIWGIGMIAYLLLGGSIDERLKISKCNGDVYNERRSFVSEDPTLPDSLKDFVLK